MINNDSALQLSNVLNQDCTRSGVHCQSKKRALEIISELAAKQLGLPPQIVFEAILTREKMGSTGIGNGIAIPHGKLEEDTLRAVGCLCNWKRLSLLTPSITSLWICFSRCWFLPIRPKPTCTRCRWLPNVWRIKPFVVDCAQPKVMKSFIKLSLKQKAIRMRHNRERAFSTAALRRNGTWC